MPKIRKAKSQSFRTRRSPSERRSPNTLHAGTLTLNTSIKRNPILPQPDSKSPSSVSQKTPTTLSRQGTLRASHRRKNSMTGSLVLSQGRKSPVGHVNDRSPQGRRSPLLLSTDRLKSPNDLQSISFDSRSPTRSPTTTTDRRSPTFSIHTQERRSPIGAPGDNYNRRSPTSTVHVQDNMKTFDEAVTPEDVTRTTFGLTSSIKRPSLGLFTPIYFGEKKSPITPMHIPPITVSNPTETCKLVQRTAESNAAAAAEAAREHERQREKDIEKEKNKETTDKKEKTSVMKEILAFVRKPSKHISTRTRFANAFTRAETGSSSGPLIRQSTFSASPAASSTAAKSAVVKQMSEVGFEPKMSLKLAHYTKMSLKLRRSAANDDKKPATSKETARKSSGDSATDSSETKLDQKVCKIGSPIQAEPFELANVYFEKVGESYIRHEQIKKDSSNDLIGNQEDISEKFIEEVAKSLKVVTLSNDGTQPPRRSESREPMEPRISEEQEDSNDINMEEFRVEMEQHLKVYSGEPIYVNLQELKRESDATVAAAEIIAKTEKNKIIGTTTGASTDDDSILPGTLPLQLPTIEFEPPSRRSSFDPPRSPFLENLRSPSGDTDTDLIHLHRLDSGGDSFEMVHGDRNRESSFEERYSSRDTSFDISRYQSTSYEDQTSSFEIVDIDGRVIDEKKSNNDLRKSSIELVDADTFQRTGSSGRKSSLETHFDYVPSDHTPVRSPHFPMTKKHRIDYSRSRELHVSPIGGFSRARSPLSNQTSSNYSSRDSYDSSSSYPHPHDPRSPYADPSKQHFPLTIKATKEEESKTFLCTDKRCASIFEPRPSTIVTAPSPITAVPASNSIGCGGFSSGSEFEPPSPRRAASASPKHTFTFRIVLKKVDSSPEALCPERGRGRTLDRYRRGESRRKRLSDAGKSF